MQSRPRKTFSQLQFRSDNINSRSFETDRRPIVCPRNYFNRIVISLYRADCYLTLHQIQILFVIYSLKVVISVLRIIFIAGTCSGRIDNQTNLKRTCTRLSIRYHLL